MNVLTTASDLLAQRSQLIWRAGAAVTALMFLWQLPFLTDGRLDRAWSQALYYGYTLLWMLLVTAFTRTIPLRTLAAFFFVGLFTVMAVDLAIARPMHRLVGGGTLASAYLGPLIEELVKPLPVLGYLAYRAWRRAWTGSATDGLLLGYVVGAGFAIHEDAAYGRIWAEGFGRGWSMLFPTIADFRGATLPYHDVMSAVVGLALGFAFLYRRHKAAWAVPAVVWLLVLSEHVTGNLRDIGGRAPGWATFLRGLIMEGELILPVLAAGIVVAIVLEWRILRSVGREEPLFPAIPIASFLAALRDRTAGGLRRLQRMRVYARSRRSVYYSVWSDPATPDDKRAEMAATLYFQGIDAGVPVERTFMEYDTGAAPAAQAAPMPAPGG